MENTATKRKFKVKNSLKFYLYISPWLLCFLIFTILPMGFSLIMSFTNAKITTLTTRPLEFIGLENFEWIFTKDNRFLRSIGNTFLYSVLRVGLGTIFALLVAMLLNAKIAGRKAFRTMIYLPAVIPIVGSTLLWKLMLFQDKNIVSYLMNSLGLGTIDFLSPKLALTSVVGINIWSGLGPSMLILLAGLQNVPQDLIDAAQIDGANAFVKFWHITLPMISSTVFFSLITGFIGAFQAYAEVKLLTGSMSETTTMAMLVVDNAFSLDAYGMGYASAQGWFIFLITLIFTGVFFMASKKKVYYANE